VRPCCILIIPEKTVSGSHIYGGVKIWRRRFYKEFNEITHQYFPGILTIAEESTAWPSVSKPVYLGGLGFDMKWNMGWMHDMLEYISKNLCTGNIISMI